MPSHAQVLTIRIAALLASLCLWPCAVSAGDGQIVVIREVPPRNAFVRGDPGPIRVGVNPSPENEINSALGLDQTRGGTVRRELADSDISGVAAGTPAHTGRAVSATQAISQQAVVGSSAGGGSAGQAMRGLQSGTGGLTGAAGMNAGGAVQRGTQQLNSILTGTPLLMR